MIISDTLLLLCLISLSHGLGSLNSLFGDKGSTGSSASNNNMILCTVRHSVHYARVYDTVLVNKCHPTTTSSCGKGGSCGTQKKCTSKIETVYENECTTEKDQSCTTVYDTTYEDKCTTEYVRVCGGFQPVYNGGGGGYQNGIHRRMDVEDVDNEVETNSLDLTEAAANLVRKRRAPYQGAHGGQGGCNKIPQQKCNKIPHKQPRRQCSTVDKPSCHSSPRQVHKQECEDVPVAHSGQAERVHKCHQVPRKVARLVGHRVPQKHCQRLTTGAGAGQGIRLVGVFNGGGGAASVAGPVSPYDGLGASGGHIIPSSSAGLHSTGYF